MYERSFFFEDGKNNEHLLNKEEGPQNFDSDKLFQRLIVVLTNQDIIVLKDKKEIDEKKLIENSAVFNQIAKYPSFRQEKKQIHSKDLFSQHVNSLPCEL